MATKKKSRQILRDFFALERCCRAELGSAALAVQVLVILFVLSALLLSALLAGLSGLALLTLLSGLVALLIRLSTLLAIAIHIVCHE
jgi:hypothetical protein